jgi:hypothetical protein
MSNDNATSGNPPQNGIGTAVVRAMEIAIVGTVVIIGVGAGLVAYAMRPKGRSSSSTRRHKR